MQVLIIQGGVTVVGIPQVDDVGLEILNGWQYRRNNSVSKRIYNRKHKDSYRLSNPATETSSTTSVM